MNRTEGALVGVTTLVPNVALISAADACLESFTRALDPKLAYHLPVRAATFKQAKAGSTEVAPHAGCRDATYSGAVSLGAGPISRNAAFALSTPINV